jgi:uncharacterized membrane protein
MVASIGASSQDYPDWILQEDDDDTAPSGPGLGCPHCSAPLHEHEKTRVYPDDGPAGTYHYEYHSCPGGFDRPLLEGFAGVGGED